jgi:deoxyribodipyrimidine photo-lyase
MPSASSVKPTLLWFRQDLRLQDNPALHAALERGGAVVPVYVLDDAGDGRWPAGGASRWWLHHSLAALDVELRERGSRLILARGESGAVLKELQRQTGAGAVYWNRRYEPAAIARDSRLKAEFVAVGVEVKSFNAALLHEPHTIANKQGKPFQVFTPYWRHCLTLDVAAPIRLPAGGIAVPKTWPASVPLDELELRPRIPWDAGFGEVWTPGETGAAKRLRAFVARAMNAYSDQRNLPGIDGTSMLSPHLHFGEIGPRQIWAAVRGAARESGVFPPSKGAAVFLSEVGWREFAYHLLFHFNHTPEQPLREDFVRFPWRDDPGGTLLRAWQRGRTGYPIVDAGMRQLWHTGWMHNRVRMITGSFLVKHLRLPWNAGAAWFWDTLVDADLAANTLGWQWTAGCGADAAPYFRVFAPVLQGQKFDTDGRYVRRWVPELAGLPDEHLHAPWEAPADVLRGAGIRLGDTYPRPIVDHAAARGEALAAFKSLRGEGVIER